VLERGVKIAYSLIGQGPPLVFLHCWSCSQSFWREQVSYFANSYTVLTLDFRGHGNSSVPDDGYTLTQLATDVHELLSELDLSQAIAVGHSMGGMVAQRWTIDYPDDMGGLVLVATTSADPDNTLISAQVADETPKLGYATALTKNFPRWFSPDADATMIEWTRTEMLRAPEQVALGLVNDYRGLDFRSELPVIDVPTLVIAAKGDASTPVTASEIMARLIPDSELVVVDGAGHFVQLERPDEVNTAIQQFLLNRGL
jgi:pimeloyl-ACP methyl ester carboxylesterase